VGCLRYPITEVYLDELKTQTSLESLQKEPNIDKLLSSPIFKESTDKKADTGSGGGDDDDKNITDVILPEFAYDLGAKIVLESARTKPGEGILVFVGGMADIENFIEHLHHVASTCCKPVLTSAGITKEGSLPYGIEVLVLHSLVDLAQQAATLDACKRRNSSPSSSTDAPSTQVVVATNIAESSLTLPNLTTVIDFGVHKEVLKPNVSLNR